MTSPETAYLIARLLTCGIWLASGSYKATHFRHTVEEMIGHGIPAARWSLPIVIGLELGGSLLLIIDSYVWLVSLTWIAFLVPASYLYHVRYMIREGTIDFVQWILFWKNVSIAGGLIALIVLDSSRPDWLVAFP